VARVVVVGGGLGGLAVAARLAKDGHQVALVERATRLGGLVASRTGVGATEGFQWDAGPAAMTLPTTIRDLFRKSGRPLERILDLDLVTEPRRHVFPDGTVLDLPTQGRADQRDAISEVLGAATADAWVATIDSLTPTWELLRTRVLEVPFVGVRSLGASAARRLSFGRSLSAFAARALPDPRSRRVLEYTAVDVGSDPRLAPAFTAVQAYVERTFGLWRCRGGFARLVDALADRVRERGVELRLGTAVVDVETDGTAVRGVRLSDGTRLPAEVVVSDIDVRNLVALVSPTPPALRRAAGRIRTGRPLRLVHLGLRGEAEELPHETVVHGTEATVVVRAPRDPALAPPEHRAVTLLLPEGATGDEDVVDWLARHGVDLRDRIVARLDEEPRPWGPTWRGPWRGLGVARNATPVRGLFLVGGTAHPGPGVPSILLGAAATVRMVDQAFGRPPR
jgi:UDP-galactopyranose mutase